MTTNKEIKQLRFYELCSTMGKTGPTVRRWIKNNIPEIKYKSGKRKIDYSPREVELIFKEYFG